MGNDEDPPDLTSESSMSLKDLLSCPILWKPSFIISFLGSAHNCIKGNFRNDETEAGKRIKNFREALDSNPEQVIGPDGNWKGVLGDAHFKILTTRAGKDINTTSIVNLLGQLRNKYEHSDEFSDSVREELGWFPEGEKPPLDKSLYCQYIITRFPKLLGYLWVKFYEFEDALREFYPEKPHPESSFDLNDFVEKLHAALQSHLDEGGLKARYSTKLAPDGKVFHLEFRHLPTVLVQQILSGDIMAQIEVSKDYVKLMRLGPGSAMTSMKFGLSSECKLCKESGSIIIQNIGDESNDVGLSSSINSLYSQGSRRMIILTETAYDKGRIDKIAEQVGQAVEVRLNDNPAQWLDLGKTVRESFCQDSFGIKMQGKEVSSEKFFLKNDSGTETILSFLSGDNLNELLKTRKLEIFRNLPEIPSTSEIYIERRICDRSLINAEAFLGEYKNDIFVILNLAHEKLAIGDKNICTGIPSKRVFPKLNTRGIKSNVLVLKSKFLNFDEKVRSFKGVKKGNKNVHFVRHLGKSTFQWHATFGSFTGVEQSFAEVSSHVGIVKEEKILENLQKLDQKVRIIFISDKPGNGKTQFLIRLSSQLMTQNTDKLIIFMTMTDFIDILIRNTNVSCEQIEKSHVVALLTMVIGSSPFEQKLIEYRLNNHHCKIEIEILLDGLDEVNHDLKDLSFKILKIIQNDFHYIRPWVTIRDYMLEDIRVKFGCLGYKLEPFSDNDQISFLEQHWLQYWKQSGQPFPKPNSKVLRKFAETCIKIPLSYIEQKITGIPLQCKMIAEIYERKVLSCDFTLADSHNHSLISLYEKLIDRKLEVYLKEKKKLVLMQHTYPTEIKMNDDIVNTFREYLETAHIYFAIELLFPNEFPKKILQKLFSTLQIQKSSIEPTLLGLGLIQSFHPLTFIHRTFAEYYVARFVYKIMTSQVPWLHKNNTVFESFLCKNVLAVEARILHFGSITVDYIFELRNPTLWHFLSTMWESRYNLLAADFKPLLSKTIEECRNSFNIGKSLRKRAPLIAVAYDKRYNNIAGLLLEFPKQFRFLFVTALICQQFEFCKYVIEHFREFKPKHWHKFQNIKPTHKYGILHWVVKGFCWHLPKLNLQKVYQFINFLVKLDGSILEAKDAKGKTPFMLFLKGSAIFDGCFLEYSLTKYFIITLGVNVNAIDNDGNTCLHFSHIFKQRGCTRETINALNFKGDTPLTSIIKMLAQKTVYSSLKQDDIDHAFQCFQVFQFRGGDFNKKDSNGNSALHTLIMNQVGLEFVKKFLTFNANRYKINGRGQSALHLAVEVGSVDLVKWLVLKNMGDLSVRDGEGKTVLQYKTKGKVHKFLKFMVQASPQRALNLIGIQPLDYVSHLTAPRAYDSLRLHQELWHYLYSEILHARQTNH